MPGKGLSHHPWRYFKDVWMWHFGTWFGDALGSAGVVFGTTDLRSFIQPKLFYYSLIQCIRTDAKTPLSLSLLLFT